MSSLASMTFKEYLDFSGETQFRFSKRAFLCYNTVRRLYLGQKVKKHIAKHVVKATGKLVAIYEIPHEYSSCENLANVVSQDCTTKRHAVSKSKPKPPPK